MKFVRLLSVNDIDIARIQSAYNHFSISRFISVDKNNYWHYITKADNVYFYKVYNDNKLMATIHCERYDRVLHIAVVVFPEYQNMGYGMSILRAVQNGNLDISFDKIHASIEIQNTASLRLFEKVGFNCIGKDEELLEYEYPVV